MNNPQRVTARLSQDSPHPPPLAAASDLISDVKERENRLTALVNVLGFPSLDDLEDFVFLHGAAKVVPAAQRDTLSLEETQTQLSEGRLARRNEERKAENARLCRDLAQARDELVWLRTEMAKERTAVAALTKDKERLLDLVESLRRSAEQPPLTGAHGSAAVAAFQPSEGELDHWWAEIAALKASVGTLEQERQCLIVHGDECEAQVRELQEVVRRLQEDKARAEATSSKSAQVEETMTNASPTAAVGAKLANSKRSPPTSQTVAPSTRISPAIASPGLPRAPPTPRQKRADIRALTPRSRSRESPPESLRRNLDTVPTSLSPVHHSSLALQNITAIASAPTSTSPVLSQTLPVFNIDQANAEEAQSRLSLYPKLRSKYMEHRAAILALQSSLPALNERLSALPFASTAAWRKRHGPPPVIAAAELELFRPADSLPEEPHVRRAMVLDGSLSEMYGALEAKEKELDALVRIMTTWDKSATKLLARLAASPRVQEGSASSKKRTFAAQDISMGEDVATPTGQAVRKRRKIVKAATPASSTPTNASAPSIGTATRPESTAINRASLVPGAASTTPHAAVGPLATGPVRSSPRWNLVSPTKRSRISPSNLSGSGLKAQLWRTDENMSTFRASEALERGAALLDAPQPERKLYSDDASTIDPEPDTLRTDESSQLGPIRAFSPSPRKPAPRRASSVISVLGAKLAGTAEEDDVFAVRPLQPSPNVRTAASQAKTALSGPSPIAGPSRRRRSSPSPSPSPSQVIRLGIPPSTQRPGRFANAPITLSKDENASEDDINAAGASGVYRRELRFFGRLGTPPLPDSTPEQAKDAVRRKLARTKRLTTGKTHGGKDTTTDVEETVLKLEDEPDLHALQSAASTHSRKRRRVDSPASSADDWAVAGAATSTKADDEAAPYPSKPFPEGADVTEQEKREWIAEMRSKRRARWSERSEELGGSHSASRPKLEINPDRNQGEAQLFKETERRKKERQKMLAEPCQQCVEYYERAGKPVRCAHVQQGPRSVKRHLDYRAEEQEARRQANRVQAAGRHRVQQRTEKEPPDYWQMGMPSSGQIEEINRRAREQNEERRAYQEKEAQQANGLYRYRAVQDAGR